MRVAMEMDDLLFVIALALGAMLIATVVVFLG